MKQQRRLKAPELMDPITPKEYYYALKQRGLTRNHKQQYPGLEKRTSTLESNSSAAATQVAIVNTINLKSKREPSRQGSTSKKIHHAAKPNSNNSLQKLAPRKSEPLENEAETKQPPPEHEQSQITKKRQSEQRAPKKAVICI